MFGVNDLKKVIRNFGRISDILSEIGVWPRASKNLCTPLINKNYYDNN